MPDMAKVPHWRDMDWSQFLQHWDKRHSYEGVFDTTSDRFPDDDAPIWYAIRSLHDRIHDGKSEFPIPADHIHLPPVPEEIKRALEELI